MVHRYLSAQLAQTDNPIFQEERRCFNAVNFSQLLLLHVLLRLCLNGRLQKKQTEN